MDYYTINKLHCTDKLLLHSNILNAWMHEIVCNNKGKTFLIDQLSQNFEFGNNR